MINRKELEKTIISFIEKETGESKININSSLTKEAGADSLDLANVVIDIEEKYGIVIPEDIQEKLLISNVSYLVDVVEKIVNNSDK